MTWITIQSKASPRSQDMHGVLSLPSGDRKGPRRYMPKYLSHWNDQTHTCWRLPQLQSH